jgi:PAS domain S-box-containing protein
MDELVKILFVEDVPGDAELIWREIEKAKIKFEILLVENRKGYLHGLDVFKPDIIVSDFTLPQFDGMQALLIRNEMCPLIPFILVTGSMSEEVAVDCMKSGADDYILKENLSRLGPALINSINKIKLLNEKNLAKEELEKSELRLQKAQKIAHVGNWELNLSTKSIWCSEEALRIYGFERESHIIPLELVQKSPLPEFRPMLDETLDRLLKYNEPYEIEFNIKRANDKSIRSLYSRAELALADDGQQITVIGVIQDITDRKKAELALTESEKKYYRIFENVQDLYYEAAIDGTIIDVSPSIELISKGQYKRTDLIGRSMHDFYSDLETRKSLLKALKDHGSVSDYEVRLINLDGSMIPCSISSKICFDTNGNPEKIIGSMRDITARKKAEEELIKAKDKAEESDRLKTAFLQNISHEIRTPMNAIFGFSALLGEADIDNQTRNSYIDMILKSSNHLLSIITDIVDISNIEANVVKITKSAVVLNSLIRSICDQYLLKIKDSNIGLVLESDIADENEIILTDNTKLIQVLSNLLNNALKFTKQGEIRFGYKIKDKVVEFFVSDTGIGIPEEYRQKIFDRFFQIENPTAKIYEGTGLGLAICRAYVELLGGEIWLTSTAGAGSTFYFTLPNEKPVENVEPDPVIARDNTFVFAERKTIMVVEDIDSNFKLINYFFSRANVEVIRANNGKEAVEKAFTEKIDLILMDIKMPVMDGYTATRLIRVSKPEIPIIAQTAYADDREKAVECGCSGFISKPFDKKGLFKVISEFI